MSDRRLALPLVLPGRPPEFLSTHTSEETRIWQIDGWMAEAMRYYKPRP
jgi:hypothetical protein